MGEELEEIINRIKNENWYHDQMVHIEVIPEQLPKFGNLDFELNSRIREYLKKNNIKLYSHQAAAVNALLQGKDVMITTPTASGKTLAFNIPIIEGLLNDPNATALYIYPAKALTNDQLNILKNMEIELGISLSPNVYDGDTDTSVRTQIRSKSRIILSNPYALHQYLPHHTKWSEFFKKLKYIVIDEAHRYRGVIGSNFALLIRRLLRICKFYKSNPNFVLSSATIANPMEFSQKFIGRSFEIISDNGAARGKKYFVFWNPIRYPDESIHIQTRNLFIATLRNKLQTLCFTISRRLAELMIRWSIDLFRQNNSSLKDKISPYRAGYKPEERREIEKKFREGTYRGIVSTNALELGIDIGGLDCVIISGYPGTGISTWQMAGRAGRKLNDALIFLIAFENPLDQYFMNHPDNFFSRPFENAIIDLENPYILMGQLMCASAELPLKKEEISEIFGPKALKLMDELVSIGIVKETPRGYVYFGTKRAVDLISIDNISNQTIQIMYNNRVLESMDLVRAYNEAYKDAVLMHDAETYIVQNVDLKNNLIEVIKQDVDYFTVPVENTSVRIIEEYKIENFNDITLYFGEVEVIEDYIKYRIQRYDQVFGYGEINLPPLRFQTQGMWFTIPDEIQNQYNAEDFAGAIHAIEHAMIGITPLFAMCDRWDIGGVSTPIHPQTEKASIFIYDNFEGGIGISQKNFTLFTQLLKATHDLISDCTCVDGCPSCVLSPKCGNNNEPMNKKVAIDILEQLLTNIRLFDKID